MDMDNHLGDRLLCPSMMCAAYDALRDEVKRLDEAGADIFHIDVMDGRFVANFGMGTQDIACIRKNTRKEIEVHLMIEDPGNYIAMFAALGADILYIHPESDRHPARTLQQIRNAGKKAGIALNPGTSVEMVHELLPLTDIALLMTVNPGFAGQQYLEFVNQKIRRMISLKKQYPMQVFVDGAISAEKINELSLLGVDGFVLGTSVLFGKGESYAAIFARLKAG